jgi:acetyl-CoA synthetase
MEFIYRPKQKELYFRFVGELDSSVATERGIAVASKLDEILGPGQSSESLRIVFDMTEVNYASSLFLRCVVTSLKRVPRGHLKLIGCERSIQDLFRIARLDQLVEIETLDEEKAEKEPVYAPSAAFSAGSHVGTLDMYHEQHAHSVRDPEGFWGDQARNELLWDQPFTQTREWDLPHAQWFTDGKLNVSVNCLDRHLDTPTADKPAILWEGEPASEGDPAEKRTLTYRELHREVCRFANVLRRHGVGKGDRVLIYLPLVPEAVIAMQACARIGAIHSVIFAGFSPQAIAERADDCQAKLIVTADGSYRRGKVVSLKKNVDDALAMTRDADVPIVTTVEHVIVLQRAGNDIHVQAGRDVWWHEELQHVSDDCPPESLESEAPLFILYTSGSTGKPKGILHTTAGYLLYTKLTCRYAFDLREEDVFWCTADVGWITGHSYVTYGPLANGATVLLYEGAPNHPDPSRFWRLIEDYGVTIFYTAPTAIRAFMQWGEQWLAGRDLSSLRLLGTVGEPINPHAWQWYYEHIGQKRCPIVDTWWQTETGGIVITPMPGATPLKPGSATLPFFGIDADVVNEKGESVPPNENGYLVIRQPWPGMLRGIWGDEERFHEAYWKDFPGLYAAGDGARRDADGYFWITGRIDDVINVSGHRIGTAEVESALVSHDAIAEAAVVSRADDLKGSALVVFVTLMSSATASQDLIESLRTHVAKQLGPVCKPDEIRFVEALPKTRSGKIMRRLLKQVAAGTEITGDITTLEDLTVLANL